MRELDPLITEAFLSEALFNKRVVEVIDDLMSQYSHADLAAVVVGLQALEARRFIEENRDWFKDISKYDRPTIQ